MTARRSGGEPELLSLAALDALLPVLRERRVRTPYDGPDYSTEALDALMREPPGRGRDDSD